MDRRITPHKRVTSPTWSPPPLPPLHLNVNTPQVCKQFGKVYKVPNSLNLTTNCIFENYAAEGHRFLIPLARIKFPLVQYIVHNYSFIYLVNFFFIYLFIGNPFTNNFVCCQNNWENMITRDKGLRKKSNDLTVCFPGKSETKPKPNLTHCHCKRTPVHFWLTSVFCFSLSFFFFSMLTSSWVFCLQGNYWCNQHQCKPLRSKQLW